MRVYWFEQRQSDIPPDDSWLSAQELQSLGSLRFPKRRADWRLGRWTAKRTVAAHLHLPALTDIEVRPAASGAPQVFVDNRAAPVVISLSHRDGVAACALAHSGAILGCDLEAVEPRSDSFIEDYFAEPEEQMLAGTAGAERDTLVTLIWSIKESTLKALQVGLRADTRDVIVSQIHGPAALHDGWRPLQAQERNGRTLHGWWRCTQRLVRTLVALPPCCQPIELQTAQHEDAQQDIVAEKV